MEPLVKYARWGPGGLLVQYVQGGLGTMDLLVKYAGGALGVRKSMDSLVQYAERGLGIVRPAGAVR